MFVGRAATVRGRFALGKGFGLATISGAPANQRRQVRMRSGAVRSMHGARGLALPGMVSLDREMIRSRATSAGAAMR